MFFTKIGEIVDVQTNSKVLLKVVLLMSLKIFIYCYNNEKKPGIIYILEWTPPIVEPFNFLEKEQNAFNRRKCRFTNCFLTSNHDFFVNILDYDVIMFNVVHLFYQMDLPSRRSQRQKYILVAMEPASYFPIPTIFDDYFNFTWTYKLDSDVPFPYIVVKNNRNEVVGPKPKINWMDVSEMNETTDDIKRKLQNKTIAAAWIASNCQSFDRLYFIQDLQKELAKYGHRVDVYGSCGDRNCPRQEGMEECYALVESDYYFYLAFENSFGYDYVSEKILHGLEHYAVPIVLGGADYNRFLPKGIYLNAKKFGPERLANRMYDMINDKEDYYNFFRWHGYYSFHFTGEDQFQREVCGLCELLNNKTRMRATTIWKNIVQWWNEPAPTTRETFNFIIDEEDVTETGVEGFAVKLYDYVFRS